MKSVLHRFLLGFTALLWLVTFTAQGAEQLEKLQQAFDAYMAKDFAKSFELFNQPELRSNPSAQFFLGNFYLYGVGVEENLELGKEYLKHAADAGVVEAMYLLGLNLVIRFNSTEEGVVYLLKAKEKGHLTAASYLGSYYMTGTYVEKDPERGIELFRFAAEKGDVRSQYFMYQFCAEAKYIACKTEETEAWLQRAAASGSKEAARVLTRRASGSVLP